MKPTRFDYLKPDRLPDALDALAERSSEIKILAGGQSLMPALNFRLARPAVLLDINEVRELQYVRAAAHSLHIGAITRHCYFHKPEVGGALGGLLKKVVHHIAHHPIRQRGTFAGSLAHADPASEWCLVARTLGAEIVILRKGGERIVPAEEFFKGTFTTALREDELLAEIRLPLLGQGWSSGFYEFSRRKGDFALAMSLVAIRTENGIVQDARIGLGGISDRPLRLTAVEASLTGQRLDETVIERVSRDAQNCTDAIEDIHASAGYRKHLIHAVVSRALQEAAREAPISQ